MTALRDRPAAGHKRIGGRLCLDFANTVQSWRVDASGGSFEAVEDRIPEYADLLAWSLATGVLDDGPARRLLVESTRRPREAAAVVRRAHRLRRAIYGIGRHLATGKAPWPEDLEGLEGEVRAARARQRMEGGAGGLRWILADDAASLDVPLWQVALSAEECFMAGDASRLHACPGEECGWLFEDKTRNRSRQWCDMGDCGNLAKVRRFRERGAPAR